MDKDTKFNHPTPEQEIDAYLKSLAKELKEMKKEITEINDILKRHGMNHVVIVNDKLSY